MAEKKNIPEIRFKAFDGDWEERKLKDVSTYFNGGSFENNVQENGRYELVTLKSVDMSGNLVHSGRYVDIEVPTLSKGSLVMILSEQSPGLLGMTAQIPIDNKYVLNQRVAEIRPIQGIESYFLSMAINRNQQYFSSRGAGTKVQNISKPNVENYEFLCPLILEQSRIGTYFQNLDKLITLHQTKYSKLVNIKKAMLEKMFPKNGADVPEIRFKGFEGKWEEFSLGMMAETFEYGLNAAATSYDGVNKYIRITDIDDDTHVFIIDALTSPDTNLSVADNYKLKEGDLLFARTGASVGKTYYYKASDGLVYYAGFLIRARIKPEFDIKFVFQNTLTHKYDNFIRLTSQRSGQPGVNAQEYSLFKIMTPNIEEQTKIGNYFQNLDNLITLHQKELEKLKNIKKGCLERMLV
jgi:type I restriction enzyme S subunit